MRYLNCLPIALLVFVLIGCSDKGQPKPAFVPAKDSTPEWKEFSHPKGKFAVMMPGWPQEQVREVPTMLGKMTATVNVVDLKDQAKAFGVIFSDYPPGVDYTDEAFAHKVIDGVIAGNVRSRKGEVRNKSK